MPLNAPPAFEVAFCRAISSGIPPRHHLTVTKKSLVLGLMMVCSLNSFQAGSAHAAVVIAPAPDSMTTVSQARTRRGRNGWEAQLTSAGNSTNFDAPGAPFWDPSLYYDFSLTYQSSTGTTALGIDVDRDSVIETNELISLTEPSLQNETVNSFSLRLQGRSNFQEEAFVRNLNINGTEFTQSFESGFGTSEHYFADQNGADWTDVTITGQMRLSWANNGRGSQERPRIWLTLGQGVTAIPEPNAALFCFLPVGVCLLSRRRR